VLQIMLYSYAFMVSALLVPIIGGLYWKRSSNAAAWWSMITGGTLTLGLTMLTDPALPFNVPFQFAMPYGLDPIIYGLTASLVIFVSFSIWMPDRGPSRQAA